MCPRWRGATTPSTRRSCAGTRLPPHASPPASASLPMRRALVLSGGGAKASWQVGACEHLVLERGYFFDVIAGVSAGAVNGTALSQAHDHDELVTYVERLRAVWFGMRGNHDVYRRRLLGALGTLLSRQPSLYHTHPLRGILERYVDPALVAASPVKLRVGSVDLLSGTYRVAGNDHPALRAVVLASCTLPLLFPPVPLADGRELGVDGGLRRVTPLADAVKTLAESPADDGERDEVWVLTPNAPGEAEIPPVRTWLAVALRTISLLMSQAFREHGPAHPAGIDLHVMHPRAELPGPVLDFSPDRIRAWYEDGLRTARQAETRRPKLVLDPAPPEEFAGPEEGQARPAIG